MKFPDFNILQEGDPMFRAYQSSVWESDAADRLPIHVGRNILVVPDNVLQPRTEKRIVMYLGSRSAFGDGRHPTTMLCMTLLEEYLGGLSSSEKAGLSMLDIGTGTGVLAILASRMGVGNILAVDNDPDSITNATELALLNGSQGIQFRLIDAAQLPPVQEYGLVTANLLPHVLRSVLPLTAKLSVPGAPVIVSGIGDAGMCEMEKLMKDSGFTEIRRITSGWWHAYLLSHS